MAPLRQKSLALQVAAWPRCLHGISGVSISSDWFGSLRTKAIQSLGIDKPGMNPFIALGGLFTPHVDPEFYAIRLTVVSFRRFCIPDNAFPLLSTIVQLAHVRVFPGPGGVFISRLHSIGWHWLSDGWIQDHQGFRIHLLHSPIQTLLSRLEEAWFARISSEAFIRGGFSGFEHCDFKFSIGSFPAFNTDQQGLLRAALGVSLPDQLRAFRQCLCEAPDLSSRFFPCDIESDNLHLFTDGSCLRPQDPLLRLASWGVVCADVLIRISSL